MKRKGFLGGGLSEGIDHVTSKQNHLGLTFIIEQLPDIEFCKESGS